jgi:branched-chain amino acid transport system substrate-binding protein
MKKYLALGLVVGLGLLVADTASAQIRMGVGGPMTGGSAAFGAQLRQGVEQAVADINAQGGILGQKIELFIGDDRADPREGVSAANKFVADGVKFVVGHFNSGVTIPASDVYQENGILMITPAATNPKVTERTMWNVFRVCGRDDQQGALAGKIIAERFKGKRVAIVHDKTTYGQGLADETRRAMAKAGLKDVMYEGVNKDDKDFNALISKIRQARADLVFFGGLTDDEFASIAGPGAEGTLMTFSPDPRTNPANKAILDLYRSKRMFEPQAYTLYSYAAVQIFKQAAEKANSLDPKKVAEVMRSGMVFNTVLGELTFDKKGDVSEYTVGKVKKDRYVLYTWRKGPDGRITYFEGE